MLGTPAVHADALTTKVRRWEAQLLLRLLESLGPFRRILEIGAGDGLQVAWLAQVGEVYPSDLVRGAASRGGRFVQCSAGALPYAGASFDAVFTSNVLEHVVDKGTALREMARVARPEAVFVHVVPTRFWKVLHLLTHYPVLALSLVASARQRWVAKRAEVAPKGAPVGASRGEGSAALLRQRLLPEVHGASGSHRQEFRDWQRARWCQVFASEGYRVEQVLPLLAYSPSFPLVPPNRWLAQRGFASTVAYVLRRERDEQP